ncbi:MAG: chromate transporter [Lachnospiraceae bacterium]|nr:chromate transporter [Lachnospiraceae bacterium]
MVKYREKQKKRSAMGEKKTAVLKKLFFSTLYLSAFTFGGGYVIVTLLKRKFVDELHWIEEDEMLDYVAIAQSSPGPIAVNGAIVVGYQLAGLKGVLVSVLGAILPPFVILTVVSFFYSAFKDNFAIQALLSGMRAGVSAVILSIVWDMFLGVLKGKDWVLLLIMAITFVLNYFVHINVIWLILGTALFGVVRALVRQRGGKG